MPTLAPYKSTARPVTQADLDLRDELIASRPDAKRVVVYSSYGFVAAAYRWPCAIERAVAERQADGTWRMFTEWADAHRSHGRGPRATVNNRRA